MTEVLPSPFRGRGRGWGSAQDSQGRATERLSRRTGSSDPLPRSPPLRGREVVFALLILLFAFAAHAAPKFPALTGRVVDDAHVLSAGAQQQITSELADLEAKTGRQLVVVTLPSLQGYAIDDYGYQLGRAWGIGQKGQNNGALFIVAPSEHKVRVEVGYGLEPVLTDALSSVILQEKVLPKFRSGDVQGGVLDGTAAIVQQLNLPDEQAKQNVAQAEAAPPAHRSHESPVSIIFTVFILFWVLSAFIGALGGRRGRGGGGAWWLLPLMLSGRGGGWGGGSGGGFGGGGGFSGGGGSFGGGGASGSW